MTNLNNWDRWYLHLAREAAAKSKDPSTKVGCFISDEDHRPVSFGINGLPAGVKDTPKRLNNREFKLKATIHAELNAALFANQSLRECTAYVWPLPPCLHCTSVLIQKKIKRIVVLCDKTSDRYKRWEHQLPAVIAFCQEAGVILDIEFEDEQAPTDAERYRWLCAEFEKGEETYIGEDMCSKRQTDLYIDEKMKK